MKQILQILGFWVFIIALSVILSGCKTQSTIHNSPSGAQSTIIRDSISVTYRQGKEQPASPDAIGAATYPICVIEENGAKGTSGLAEQTHRAEPCSTGTGRALAARNKKSEAIAMAANLRNSEASGRPLIRVDTIVIEKWHTQKETEVVTEKYTPPFYKRCAWGFWILLLLILSSIAIRILRLIYFKR